MGDIGKRNIKIYGIIFLFLIYVVALIFNNDLWGNILSTVVAFTSAYIIWIELKNLNNKWNWATLFLVAFSWGFADFIWFITEEIFLIDPSTIPAIEYIYLLCNIAFTACCAIYFYYNLRKWNALLLLMDIVVVGTMILTSIFIIIFSKFNINTFFNAEYISTFLFLFFDFLSISSILIIIMYSKRNIASKSEKIILISIIIYILCDLYYVYLIFADKYDANTLIDGFFMLPIVLIALAAMEESKNPTPIMRAKRNALPENCGKFGFYKWMWIFPFAAYFISSKNLLIVMHMIILIVVYIFIRGYIQLSIKNEYYLKREKSINDILDNTVRARTMELIATNKVLDNLSKQDALTGFFSRRYFIECIDSLITSSKEKTFAIFFMDLDRFKSINDTHGHEMGDNVLREISSRLKKWCPPNVNLARVGGDEFGVLIEGDVSKEVLSQYANEIIYLCQKPIIISPYTLHVGISIGISIYPVHSNERDSLMRYADIAMYQLKKNYFGERFVLFDNNISKEIQRKHKIELLLQDANFDKEFELYYQPQYRTSDNTLVGMEALIRWNSPIEGYIFPSEFIPIAEETSLIIKIGEWVFDEAIKQVKIWNDKYNLDLKVGINISPKHIDKTDFSSWLREKIQNSKINTKWIELEITESSAMNSEISMEEIFSYLGSMHISIAIDDFGTGYSSLSYMKRFHIDRLKIAKELIDNIANDNNTLVIVKAIIMMTKGMGLKTIAEGVEEEEQLMILKELECDEIQGYIYGKPVNADTFEKEHIIKNLVCKKI